MATIHVYNEKRGDLTAIDDVLDVMVTVGDTVRVSHVDGTETTADGLLFKGVGKFQVWIEPFHGDEIQTYESIVDPLLMPRGVIKLQRDDGVKASLRGEILRLRSME